MCDRGQMQHAKAQLCIAQLDSNLSIPVTSQLCCGGGTDARVLTLFGGRLWGSNVPACSAPPSPAGSDSVAVHICCGQQLMQLILPQLVAHILHRHLHACIYSGIHSLALPHTHIDW